MADPYLTNLAFLQEAYAAGGGTPNAFRPGAQGIPGAAAPTDESGGVPGISGSLGGGAVGGGSVPGTATTGPGVLDSLLASGGFAGGDPVAGRTLSQLFGGESDQPGQIGEIGEGDLGLLAAMFGGPLGVVPIVMASLVASEELGLPPDPSLLLPTNLARLTEGGDSPEELRGDPFDPQRRFERLPDGGRLEGFASGVQGVPFSERETGLDPFGRTTGLAPAPGRDPGSLGISFAERERFGPAGPGAGPSRGTISNAGR